MEGTDGQAAVTSAQLWTCVEMRMGHTTGVAGSLIYTHESEFQGGVQAGDRNV